MSFGENLLNMSDEAYEMQVTALIKLKECEDTHLGEEVDRNWFEVVTQQYIFDRLSKEVRRRLCFECVKKKIAISLYFKLFILDQVTKLCNCSKSVNERINVNERMNVS